MKYLKLLISLSGILLFIGCGSSAVSTGINTNRFLDIEWQMQEIRFLQQNQPYYYLRNGSSNTINFDNDFIKFKKDGTGVYHQSDNINYDLTWHFDDSHKTLFMFTINNFRKGQPLIVHWENMQLKHGILSYSEYYTNADGVQSLGIGVRTIK